MPAYVQKTVETPIQPLKLAHAVARASGLESGDLFGPGVRHESVVRARECFCWLLRQHTTMSYPEIARLTGTVHSVVWRRFHKWERRLETGTDEGLTERAKEQLA